MTFGLKAAADGLSATIQVGGVDKLTVDNTGTVTANKFTGDGSALTGIIKSGTAINTTSGTAIDFTGIPAGVKRITVMLRGVSSNGSSPFLVQVGSGSVVTTGYSAQTWVNGAYLRSTTGFPLNPVGEATYGWSGVCVLTKLASNMWSIDGSLNVTAVDSYGSKTLGDSPDLSGALDRVRITTVNGTDVFDLGSINILYE